MTKAEDSLIDRAVEAIATTWRIPLTFNERQAHAGKKGELLIEAKAYTQAFRKAHKSHPDFRELLAGLFAVCRDPGRPFGSVNNYAPRVNADTFRAFYEAGEVIRMSLYQ